MIKGTRLLTLANTSTSVGFNASFLTILDKTNTGLNIFSSKIFPVLAKPQETFQDNPKFSCSCYRTHNLRKYR